MIYIIVVAIVRMLSSFLVVIYSYHNHFGLLQSY